MIFKPVGSYAFGGEKPSFSKPELYTSILHVTIITQSNLILSNQECQHYVPPEKEMNLTTKLKFFV